MSCWREWQPLISCCSHSRACIYRELPALKLPEENLAWFSSLSSFVGWNSSFLKFLSPAPFRYICSSLEAAIQGWAGNLIHTSKCVSAGKHGAWPGGAMTAFYYMSNPRQKHSSSLLERETACPGFLQNPNIWSFCIAWCRHIYCLQQSSDSQMIHLKWAALTIHPFLSQQGIKMRKSSWTNIHTPQKETTLVINMFFCAALLMSKERHVLDQDNQLLLVLLQGELDWMILVELFWLRTL